MADTNVQVLIRLRDELSAQIKQTESNVGASIKGMKQHTDSLSESFTKLAGVVAGAFALEKIVEFGKKGVEEFQANAAAAARLTTVLGQQSAALDQLANSLAKTSTYKKEEITNAEAAIARYARSETAIKALTPAVLNLASATGLDLTNGRQTCW